VENLKRFQELHQILVFLFSESQLQVLVIVLNNLFQSLEAAIVVEPAFLVAP
jgi:hypothetical protein